MAELKVRIAVLNGYTALGIPNTEAVGQVRRRKEEPQPSSALFNRAPETDMQENFKVPELIVEDTHAPIADLLARSRVQGSKVGTVDA